MQTDKLTVEQAETLALTDGVVVAGAGAGKTRTLIARIMHDQQHGVPAADQIVVTFTNAAANEMRERLAARGGMLPGHLGTLHSLALRAVKRAWGGDLAVMDDRAFDALIRATCRRTRVNAPVSTVRGWIIDPPRAGNGRLLVAGLMAAMRGDRVIHPDVMLAVYRNLLETSPETRNLWVYVDEAQDSSAIDAAIYGRLAKSGRNSGHLILFGDPRQAIYGFRGADPEIFTRALTSFGDVAELTRNFRSGPAIIGLANRIAARMDFGGYDVAPMEARDYPPADLICDRGVFQTTEQEAMALMADLCDLGMTRAVLTRYNATADVVAAMLRADGIEVETPRRAAEVDPSLQALAALTEIPTDWRRTLAEIGVPFATQDRLLPFLAAVADPMEIRAAIDEALDRPPAMSAGRVWVSTIHAAKGLEWDAVALVGADSLTLCPSNQEDVRLAYVAVTRARSRFLWSSARNRPAAGGRRVDGLTPSTIFA